MKVEFGMLEWILGCILVLLLLYLTYEGTRGMPGPWGVPLLGYLPFLNPGSLHVELAALKEKYGPLYRLKLGQKRVVVICDRQLIKEALALPELAGRPTSGLTALLAAGGHSCLNFRSADAPGWERNRQLATAAVDILQNSKGARIEQDVSRALHMFNRLLASHTSGRPVSVAGVVTPIVETLMSGLCLGRPVALGDPLLK